MGKYATTEEYNKRREIFVERYNDMLRHNQEYEEGKVSWWRKVTEHYDLTNEEIEAQLNLGMMPVEKEYMPSSVDEQMEARIRVVFHPSRTRLPAAAAPSSP